MFFLCKIVQIQPIKYNDEYIGGGVNCTLTGWGYTTVIRFGPPPNRLQIVELPSITNDECTGDGNTVDKDNICTQGPFFVGACGVCIEVECIE